MKEFTASLLILIIPFATSVIASIVNKKGYLSTLITAIVTFCCFAYLYYKKASWLPVRSFSEEKNVKPHKCLIIPLTASSLKYEINKDKIEVYSNNKNSVLLSEKDMHKDIDILENAKNKGIRWNWQQLLRGIEPHINEVKEIYIIGSAGERGSFAQRGDAKSLINFYNNEIDIICYENAVNFESIKDVQKTINFCIKELRKKKYHEGDIVVDVTGGLKPTSIAGIAATLDKRIKAQYVQTNLDVEDGRYHVLHYDVATESP